MCNGQDLTRQPLHQGIISSDKKIILEIPPQKVYFFIQIISGFFAYLKDNCQNWQDIFLIASLSY
ncbi:MAG: hypothetical protein A2139_14670 [Desulfobacca sp. RBG_16_60_12]|nr:MAG: hypothetical protein A2139_14670 [Desulfobacca sp. RBG_16_60_12]